MKDVALLVAGFLIWSIAFLAIYAVQATGCAIGMPSGLLRETLVVLLAVFLLAGGVVLVIVARNRNGPLGRSAILASMAALVASALTFSGVVWASLC